MQTRNHIYGAVCMSLAVAAFAVNDAITKYLTKTLSQFSVLSVRALIGFAIISLYGYFSGVSFTKDLFGNALTLLKSVIFVVCICLFATSFKFNSFVQFYTVFFLILPLASIFFQLYFFRKSTPLIVALPLAIMIASVIYPYINKLEEIANISSLYAAATATFYALFLAISQYVNRKYDSDVVTQSIPLFFFATLLLGSISLIDNTYRSDLFDIMLSGKNILLTMLASVFSIFGLIFITRATYYDDASRIAPYEYLVIVFAFFIDTLVFSNDPGLSGAISAGGVVIGAVVLSKIQERTKD